MDQPHLPFLRSNYTPPATSPSNTQQYSEAGLSQYFKQDCVFQIPIVWGGTELRLHWTAEAEMQSEICHF